MKACCPGAPDVRNALPNGSANRWSTHCFDNVMDCWISRIDAKVRLSPRRHADRQQPCSVVPLGKKSNTVGTIFSSLRNFPRPFLHHKVWNTKFLDHIEKNQSSITHHMQNRWMFFYSSYWPIWECCKVMSENVSWSHQEMERISSFQLKNCLKILVFYNSTPITSTQASTFPLQKEEN